jgi:CRP/FNR family transcriptional regulator, polysaccharide utilization system transcription regulator
MFAEYQYSLIDISIFNCCDSEDIAKIEHRKRLLNLRGGEYIVQEGEQPKGVFCLLNGAAKILKKNTRQEEKIVSLAKVGDILGLRAIIDKTNYESSVVTIVNSTCCFIPREYISQIVEKYPSISMKIIISLCKELNEIEEKITSITHKSVSKRLAEILLILVHNYGLDKNCFLRITPSWDDIASLGNITHKTLIRLLNEFKNKGIIGIQDSRIKIFSSSLLEEMVG